MLSTDLWRRAKGWLYGAAVAAGACIAFTAPTLFYWWLFVAMAHA
jgi:hypothetical protein